MKHHTIIAMTLLLFIGVPGYGDPVLWQAETDENKVTLIELYTSQGCSSCPRAEMTLNDLDGAPLLWKRFVPLALHVDYWNYIGWHDPFSKKQYSQRQRQHLMYRNVSSVYTPGWLVNGEEWLGFFRRKTIPLKQEKTIALRATLTKANQLRVDIPGEYTHNRRPAYIYTAILGSGYSHRIDRGENHGRTLLSNFVVLELVAHKVGYSLSWDIPLSPVQDTHNTKKLALAVWLSDRHDRPIQAVGNWIDASLVTAH